MSQEEAEKRERAVELAARFAVIGEDAAISVARAEMFYDFIYGRLVKGHDDEG